MLGESRGQQGSVYVEALAQLRDRIKVDPRDVTLFARWRWPTRRYYKTRHCLKEKYRDHLDLNEVVKSVGDSFVEEIGFEHCCTLNITVTAESEGLAKDLALSLKLTSISTDEGQLRSAIQSICSFKTLSSFVYNWESSVTCPVPWPGEAVDFASKTFPELIKSEGDGMLAYIRTMPYSTLMCLPKNCQEDKDRLGRILKHFLSDRSVPSKMGIDRFNELELVESTINSAKRVLAYYRCEAKSLVETLDTDYSDVADDLKFIQRQLALWQECPFQVDLQALDDRNSLKGNWKYDFLKRGSPRLKYKMQRFGADLDPTFWDVDERKLESFCNKRDGLHQLGILKGKHRIRAVTRSFDREHRHWTSDLNKSKHCGPKTGTPLDFPNEYVKSATVTYKVCRRGTLLGKPKRVPIALTIVTNIREISEVPLYPGLPPAANSRLFSPTRGLASIFGRASKRSSMSSTTSTASRLPERSEHVLHGDNFFFVGFSEVLEDKEPRKPLQISFDCCVVGLERFLKTGESLYSTHTS